METQARVRELFDYSPETGVIRWRERPLGDFTRVKDWKMWKTLFAGREAGCIDRGGVDHGYRVIKVDGKTRAAHRVIWLYVYGKWPDDQIDHINGNRSDNRLCNLREATPTVNSQNRKRHSNNGSGILGVHWVKREAKWKAGIMVAGKAIHLGLFHSLEDAAAARAAASIKYDFSPNHGRAA